MIVFIPIEETQRSFLGLVRMGNGWQGMSKKKAQSLEPEFSKNGGENGIRTRGRPIRSSPV